MALQASHGPVAGQISDDFVTFAVKTSAGHIGVAAGLRDASRRVPEALVMATVKRLGVTGQALYNLYGEWMRSDDLRFEACPSFADYLVCLVDSN